MFMGLVQLEARKSFLHTAEDGVEHVQQLSSIPALPCVAQEGQPKRRRWQLGDCNIMARNVTVFVKLVPANLSRSGRMRIFPIRCAQKGAPAMKHIIRITAVVGLGLLATACDKCGNWNMNTPQLCHGTKPQG